MKLDVAFGDQGLVVNFRTEAVDNLDVGVGESRELVFLGSREESYVTSGDGAAYYDNSLDKAVLQELESPRYRRVGLSRPGWTRKEKALRIGLDYVPLPVSEIGVESERHTCW